MDCRRGTVGTGEAFSFPVEGDATQPTEKDIQWVQWIKGLGSR